MTRTRIERGRAGEEAAAHFLESRGYEILHRNYRLPLGEIDLVARDRNWIVFVEVKARTGHGYGAPAEAVDGKKQLRMTRAAFAYLAEHRLEGRDCRFDVLGVLIGSDGRLEIEHLVNAFDMVEPRA